LDSATWKASTKDHVYAYNHYLRAYAIGMKLTGVTNLRSLITLNTTPYPQPNTAGCSWPSGSGFLVGGGAYTTYTGAGELLYRSLPSGDTACWYAASTDHLIVDNSGVLKVVAIGLPQCPSGFGCLQHGYFFWNGSHGGGYQSSTSTASGGWATTSVGGDTPTDSPFSANRLLSDLIPVTTGVGGAKVWTKDHGVAQSGWSVAYDMVVAKQ
jgi:hypothetical protein